MHYWTSCQPRVCSISVFEISHYLIVIQVICFILFLYRISISTYVDSILYAVHVAYSIMVNWQIVLKMLELSIFVSPLWLKIKHQVVAQVQSSTDEKYLAFWIIRRFPTALPRVNPIWQCYMTWFKDTNNDSVLEEDISFGIKALDEQYNFQCLFNKLKSCSLPWICLNL